MKYNIDRKTLKQYAKETLQEILSDLSKGHDYNQKRKIGLVIVDYIKLLKFAENFQTTQEKMKELLLKVNK